MGYIYLIENINDTCDDYLYNYVGQTKGTVERRFNQHINGALRKEDNIYLHNAIRFYGPDSFRISVLYEVDDCLLNEYEIAEIAYRKSIGQCQYNIAAGGYLNPIMYMSEEKKREMKQKELLTKAAKSPEEKYKTHIRLSIATSGSKNGMYGKHHSQETKQKLKAHYTPERLESYRESNLGENNPMYGKTPHNKGIPHTPETKKKISEALSESGGSNYGKRYGESSNHRAVILHRPDGTTQIFSCKLECAYYLGYKYGGSLKINKLIVSDDPKRNNCYVTYL